MEKRHRELIVSNRVKLVREMFTDRIVSKMRGGLLNESDIEDITSEESAREKAEALLSILPRKGPKAFVAFVKALQEVQGYLSEPFLEEAGLPDIKEVDYFNDDAVVEMTENTCVKNLPANVHSRLCVLLNEDNVFGDNWERVYRDVGLPIDRIDKVRCQSNPTDCTLTLWHGRMGSKASLGLLISILRDIPRTDVVEMLKKAMHACNIKA